MIFKNLQRILTSICVLYLLSISAVASQPDKSTPIFNKTMRVAHVRYLSQGDFPEQYLSGVRRQANALGIEVDVYDARQDASLQRNQLEQAIMKGYDGIILQHGFADSLKDLADEAVKQGIKIVAFDVNINNPSVPQVEQDDHAIARLSLEQAVKDNGENWQAAYVYTPGIPPLDRRNEIFSEFKKRYSGIKEVARFGTLNNPIPNQVADQAAAVFRANPQITVAFSPYDEFAKGIKIAVDEAGLSRHIKIYSADISTSDIQAMREPESAWVATACTNPAIMGQVTLRALAILLKGEDPGQHILVPPVLITQQDLNSKNIRNMQELAEKIPEFANSDILIKDWMPDIK